MDVIIASILGSLALLLLTSGAAKLLTRQFDESALNVMALPAVVNTRVVRTGLPWVEILLALALVLSSGIVLWAATAAVTVLFISFTVFVTIGVRQGDPASCGCFGALSRAPMSWRTVVRNMVFVALAVLAFIVTSTGSYGGPALPLPWWAVVAAAVPLGVLGVILWAELGGKRSRGSVSNQLGAIPPLPAQVSQPSSSSSVTAGHETSAVNDEADENYVRMPVPFVSVLDSQGQRVSVRGLAQSQARALFYVNPGCAPCDDVLERLVKLPPSLGPVALHTVVSEKTSLAHLPDSLSAHALVDSDRALASSFDMVSNPWSVVLGADGLLAGGPEVGSVAVTQLLNELIERFHTA